MTNPFLEERERINKQIKLTNASIERWNYNQSSDLMNMVWDSKPKYKVAAIMVKA